MRLDLARLGAAATLALLALPACAHHAGKGAVQGAAEVLAQGQAENANDPTKQITHVATQRAVEGAIAALDDPAQQAKLRQLVNALVTEAIASAFRTATEVPAGERSARGGAGVSPVAELIAQAARSGIETAVQEVVDSLGGRGKGPLAQSIASTGREVSASVVGSALDKLTALFPGCSGPDAMDCINRQLQTTTQSAATGFSKGIRDSIGWQLLLGAVLLGLVAGIIAHWLWSLRAQTRLLRPRTT
jgi:hypothetical protein